MITKRITYCGQPATIACDAKCDKAWGRNTRPKRYLGGDPSEDGISSDEQLRRYDDFVYVVDGELGEAPADPGTYEGGTGKPQSVEARLNKWCARECERCWMSPMGRPDQPPELKDMNKPQPNMHHRRTS